VRTTVSDVSVLWAAPDHPALVAAAVDVAAADGHTYLARLISSPPGEGRPPLVSDLFRGSLEADYPATAGYVLHLSHFHHPWTHRGYAGWCLSAARALERVFQDGLTLWRRDRRNEAAYELGRATHLLVDVWIPHHAAGVAGCGHGEFEGWLADGGRWRDFAPGSGGRYQWQAVFHPPRAGPPHVLDWRSPADWVDLAAHESFPWYELYLNLCRHPEARDAFPRAAAHLVPGAIRYLAGFLHYFFTLALDDPFPGDRPGWITARGREP